MKSQIEIVNQYLNLVREMALSESNASQLLHPDYLQWELPNALNKAGQQSDLADSYRRMQMAQKIMARQTYDVTNTMEKDHTVMIECKWTGTMAIDAGPLKKDQELKAFFCMIFEFKDGKIHRVRNYDCFEAF